VNFSKNQIIIGEISDINMLGFGVAKVDGAVFFVQNGVPGDVAKLKIIKCAKNYYVCRIEELIKASADRLEPECPHFKSCGGCSFWHIRYDTEKLLKKRFIETCFRKEGLLDVDVLPVLSTNILKGYRNKAQYPVQLNENGEVISGFYSPRSHKLCKVDHCLIQDERFSKITKFLCAFFKEHDILPYDEEKETGLVRHIYLRCGKASGEIALCLVLTSDAFPKTKELIVAIRDTFPEIVSVSFNIQPDKTNVILGSKTVTVFGKEKIEDTLCGRRFLISPQSFYQVNHDGAQLLYTTAFKMADLSEYDLIVDLFCGIGSISLSANTSVPIVGVEIVPEAVNDAKKNAELNGISNAEFHCGDAADAFRMIKMSGARNPLVIVDPPRKGIDDKLISDLSDNRVKNILYISCNPETMARDVKKLCAQGYKINTVQPVDMFPRTSHVETVALLSRQSDIHNMKLNSAPFMLIKSGEKTTELRLYDEKRRNVKIGDTIVFKNTADGEEIKTTVLKLNVFNTFDELYQSLPLLKCGYTEKNISSASPLDMKRYYSSEDEEKFGVVGIEIALQ